MKATPAALALIGALTGLSLPLGITGYAATPPRHTASTAALQDLSAFIGRWQIDPSRSHMGRNGPGKENIIRSTTFSFVFTPQGQGLKMDVFASYPQPAPSHSMLLVADGKTYTCPGPESCMTSGGAAKEQTYVWQMLDPHLMTRLFYIKGQAYDYSTMDVSTDGRTMTLISWDPATPQWQNIQVLEKQP